MFVGVSRSVIITVLAAALLAGCARGDRWRGGGVNFPVSVEWHDTRWCVPRTLKRVLRDASQRFGPVVVHSSHRWPLENWRKGGKPRSFHLTCRAIDFSIPGDPDDVRTYLLQRKEVGGFSRYPQGFYHIDSGPRRTW